MVLCEFCREPAEAAVKVTSLLVELFTYFYRYFAAISLHAAAV